MPAFTDSIYAYSSIVSWHDVVEIFFFITGIYALARWFAYDTTKPLLAYFYAYLCTMLVAYWLPLPALYALLVAAWPCALTIGLLLHQHTLQKNFIGLTSFHTDTPVHHDWIKDLVRFCANKVELGRSIQFCIQKNHDLNSFIQSSISLTAPLTPGLLTILSESTSINTDELVLLNDTGTLLAINVRWKHSTEEQRSGGAYAALGKTHALTMTQQNDCIICIAHEPGLFDIIAEGKITPSVPAQSLIRHLKNYCSQSNNQPQAKVIYENTSTLQHHTR